MSEAVKVAVRCRPMSQRELQQKCRNVITIDSIAKTCTLENDFNNGTARVYQFDAAFGIDASTETVYENVGSVIVEAVLEGYNGTVFAYGQTGCGKSYTMHGFIEKTLEHLFEATSTSNSETRYLALLSYLEIYNERLRDLLQDGEGSLQLKEDPVKGTYVSGGLREVTVKNATECSKLVEQGNRRRVAAATKMNAESSRSHAVLTLSLEAIAIGDDDKKGNAVRRGRLHLVDLAGSERQTRTGATGDRLKEAASINLSLSALGNVISALAAGNGRHVPYRDSKLTRLLRDSLGGNARTLMIACVSPSNIDGEETLSTLRYAARARCIKNKPIINEDPKDALLRQYQLELQQLKKLLESSDFRVPSDQEPFTDPESKRVDDEEIERLRKECEYSNMSAQKLQEELLSLKSQVENAEKAKGPPMDPEKAEKLRRKKEAARLEVLKRLEKLTIGGEARQNEDVRKRRERRRRRLAALAEALERSAEEGNGGAFEVYGQLKSTEEALKKMAKKAKQLEHEAADLQASWDAERRVLLRRELLATQICDAMLPYLRPGCPFRDLTTVREAAIWSDELSRWRLPDVSPGIPLPPPPPLAINGSVNKSDHNNNHNALNNDTVNGHDEDEDFIRDLDEEEQHSIADVYFKRKRVNALLEHLREARTQENGRRPVKSGSSDDSSSPDFGPKSHHMNLINMHKNGASNPDFCSYRPTKHMFPSKPIGAWTSETGTKSMIPRKNNPPRILEALPLSANETSGTVSRQDRSPTC